MSEKFNSGQLELRTKETIAEQIKSIAFITKIDSKLKQMQDTWDSLKKSTASEKNHIADLQNQNNALEEQIRNGQEKIKANEHNMQKIENEKLAELAKRNELTAQLQEKRDEHRKAIEKLHDTKKETITSFDDELRKAQELTADLRNILKRDFANLATKKDMISKMRDSIDAEVDIELKKAQQKLIDQYNQAIHTLETSTVPETEKRIKTLITKTAALEEEKRDALEKLDADISVLCSAEFPEIPMSFETTDHSTASKSSSPILFTGTQIEDALKTPKKGQTPSKTSTVNTGTPTGIYAGPHTGTNTSSDEKTEEEIDDIKLELLTRPNSTESHGFENNRLNKHRKPNGE